MDLLESTKGIHPFQAMTTSTVKGIEISVCGIHELPDYTAKGITHLVSIWNGSNEDRSRDRRTHQVQHRCSTAQIYWAFFDDVEETYVTFPPTETIVREILTFTASLSAGDRFLAHCMAGISRSTAITFGVLCQHWGPGYEIECFVELKAIRPDARPNRLVVQHADAILGRGGRMIQAIKDEPWL